MIFICKRCVLNLQNRVKPHKIGSHCTNFKRQLSSVVSHEHRAFIFEIA